MKYINRIRENFKPMPFFTARDVKIVLSEYKISAGYARALLKNLVKKGEIKRLAKGVYTFHDDVLVSGFAFYPFYYGLQEALSLWNLWEQETNPVIITPRKVRQGMRPVLGARVFVRRIRRKMFFGFESIKYYEWWIPVSDPEKTLIDFVYFKEPLYDEVLREIKKVLRKDVLNSYLKRCPAYLNKRVLNLVKK